MMQGPSEAAPECPLKVLPLKLTAAILPLIAFPLVWFPLAIAAMWITLVLFVLAIAVSRSGSSERTDISSTVPTPRTEIELLIRS